jgi:hypothetical protein
MYTPLLWRYGAGAQCNFLGSSKSPLTGVIRSRTMTVTGLSIGETTGEMATQVTDR